MSKNSNKGGDRNKQSPVFVENLEPRILFSADIWSAAQVDFAVPDSEGQHNWLNGLILPPENRDEHAATEVTSTEFLENALADVISDFTSSIDGLHGDAIELNGIASAEEDNSNDPQAPERPAAYQAIIETAHSDLEFNPALPLEIVFVDAGVDNADLLIDNLRSDQNKQTQWLVVELSNQRDGVTQITESLLPLSNVDAIHIVSHSDGESIQLGNNQLDLSTITAYTDDIAAWGNALESDADLLIYGCDLAASDSGRELMQLLSVVSGSDVAASDDPTGHSDLGGDWDLEYTRGEVTTAAAFNDSAQNNWQDTLAASSSGIEINTDGGNDSYLYTSNGGAIIAGIDSMTLEFQFAIENILASNTLLSYAVATQTNNVFLLVEDDGTINFCINGAVLKSPQQPQHPQLLDGDMHSLAVSWDRLSGAVAIYVDGSLVETRPNFEKNATIYNGGTLTIGKEQDKVNGGFTTAESFSGTLYDVRIWNEVLSEREVSLNYQQKVDPAEIPFGLVANWQMESINGSGQIVDIVNGTNLSIGHATEAGFTTSTPVLDLHVSELAAADTSVGYVVASDQTLHTDIVSDGIFTKEADPATSQTYTAGQMIGDWLVTDNNVTLNNADGGFQDTTPLGGNALHLSVGTNGAIEQTLVTEVGKTYQVIFAASGHWDSPDSKALSVTASDTSNTNTQNFYYTGAPPNWDFQTSIVWEPGKMQFTAAETSTKLRFESIGGAIGDGVLLADIQVLELNDTITTLLTNDPTLSYDAATGKFYRVVNTALNFQDAIDTAIATQLNGVNGQLVTVDSVYENQIVQGLAESTTQGVWVGATDATTNPNWYWLEGNTIGEVMYIEGTGTAPGMFSGYPPASSVTGDGLRLHKDSAEWSITDTASTHSYVVEWDAASVLSRFNYALSDALNNFIVDQNTGHISVATAPPATLDYETNTSHDVIVTVTDAAGTATDSTMTITVDPINEPPIFNNLDDNSSLTENGAAVIIDTDAQIVDPELTSANNFGGAILTLQRNGLPNSDDVFSESGQLGPLIETANLTYNAITAGTVTTNSNGLLVLTFNNNATSAVVNNIIQSIAYSNTSNFPPGSVQIDWTFDDNNTADAQGTGQALTDTATTTVTINAVNDPPINNGTLPADVFATEDSSSSVDLSQIDLMDVDADNNPLTVELSTSTGGLLSSTSTASVTVSASNTTTLSLTGSQSALNAFFNQPSNIQYTGQPNVNGSTADTIQIGVSDNGNTGSGGGGVVSLGTVNVWINAVNDAPTNSGSLPAAQAVTEDNSNIFDLSAIVINDVDANGDLTITLNSTTGGYLFASNGGGVTVGGNGTESLTLTGPQASLNTYLSDSTSVTYQHSIADLNGPNADTVAVLVRDNGNTGSGGGGNVNLGTVNVNISAVNDPPTNAGSLPASLTVTEDVPNIFDLSAIDINDVDGSGDLTITLNSTTGGYLFASTGGGVTVTGDGTESLTLTGTQTSLNAYLNDLSNIYYKHPTTNLNGPNADTVAVLVHDNGNTGSGGGGVVSLGTVNVKINAVNDAPTNSGSLPAAQAVTEDNSNIFDLSAIVINDIDANGNLTITLNSTTGGYLFASNGGGVTVGGNGTESLTLTGPQASLNTYLSDSTSVTYQHSIADLNGPNADTVAVLVRDNGNTGSGGGGNVNLGTVNVNISAVNDPPTNAGSLPASLTVTEDVPNIFDLSAIDINDVDGSGDLTITLNSTTGGYLFASTGGGVTVTGDGTESLTLTGTQTSLNAYLNDLSNIYYKHPTTNLNGPNADTVAVLVHDNGNTGSGGGGVVSLGTVNVWINAVNDAPTNSGSLPAAQAVTEDNSNIFDLSAIVINDIDANGNLTITLNSTTGGYLFASNGGGVTVGGNGTESLTLTGPQASLNTYLSDSTSVTYQHSIADLNGPNADTVAVLVRDNGNTGSGGGGNVNLGTVNVNISAVNDPPTNAGSLPASLTVTEDVPNIFDLSAIDINDVDGSGDLTITLNSTTGGYLFASTGGGVTVTGDGTESLTLTGTQTSLNAYLNDLSNIYYKHPTTNLNGPNADTVAVLVHDNGNTGSGGGGVVSLGTVNVWINAVNDAPTNSGSLPAAQAVTEDNSNIFDLSAIVINDIDANGDLTITLNSTTGGYLFASNGGGVTVGGNGTESLTLTGPQASLNTYLSDSTSVTYQHSIADLNGPNADTVAVLVRDNGNTGSGGGGNVNLGTVNVNISAVNDPPTNAGSLPASLTVTEDVPNIFDLSAIDINDVDGSGDLTITLNSTTGGYLFASTGGGVTVTGDGTESLTLTGPQASLNAYLNDFTNIYYKHPTTNLNGPNADTVAVLVHDNGNTGSGGGGDVALGSINVDISAVNDRPVLATGSPQLATVFQNFTDPKGDLVSAIIASAGSNPITDVDAMPLEGIAVTEVDDSNGNWQYSSDGGSTWFSFGAVSNTSAVVLSDSANDRIRFVANFDYTGNATISYVAWDRTDAGNSGNSLVDTTTSTAFSIASSTAGIYVEPVEVHLWLSTTDDVGPIFSQNPSGVTGLESWSEGTAVGYSDPGFTLGDGNTNGTLSAVTDFDTFAADSNADLNGLHYVSNDITVSGPLIDTGTANLQSGDLIFLTTAPETLDTGTAGAPPGWSSTITSSPGELYVYRPVNLDNYENGYFRLLLLNQFQGDQIAAITLVQSQTTIGGTTVNAGDFIYTRSADNLKHNVYWHQTDLDIDTLLIDGSNLGLTAGAGGEAIIGIELVESAITTDSVSLDSGDILLSFDKQSVLNGRTIEPQDILALSIDGSNPTTFTSQIVFDGNGNANFDSDQENIDALSLIIKGGLTNQAPTLSTTATPVNYVEDGTPVIVDGTIELDDSDSPDFANGTLTVTIVDVGATNDRLSVLHQGTAGGQISVSGRDISYANTIIGEMSGGKNSNSPLVIHFNAAATETATQALMRNIVFWNTSDNPATATRTVEFELSDGDTGTSNTISQTVTLTQTADTPLAVDNNAALYFDGDDHVVVADSPALNMTNTVTMEAWIKPQAPITSNQIIINKEGEYEVGLFNDGTIRWAFDNTDPDWVWYNTGYKVSTDEWTHIAVSYDNGTITTYVNGKLVDSYSGSGTIADAHPTENTLRIGGREALAQYFTGEIDEVRLWNIARTQAEIANNLDIALTGNEPGLVGYWPLDEGTGLSTTDLSNNANHGTITSSSATVAPMWNTYKTAQNSQLTVPAATGIIANDIDGDADTLSISSINGSSANVGSLFTLPSGASLMVGINGDFSYNPDGAFDTLANGDIATDTFNYLLTDGNGTSDDAVVTIRITGTNDAPQASNLSTPEDYTEDSTLQLASIVVSDVDTSDVTVTLSLSDSAAGTLSTGTAGSVTSTFTSGVWTATGAITDVNTLLAGIIFTPATDYSSDFKIATSVTDGITPAITGEKTLTAKPINDAPFVTAPATALSATEQTDLIIHGTGFSVSDIDESASGASLTLSVGEGAITVEALDSGTTVVTGNASDTVTVTGTIDQINKLLTGNSTGTITYFNNNNTPTASTLFSVTVNDQGNTGDDPGLSGDASSEQHSNNQIINITAVNDDPVNTVTLPGSRSVTEDIASDLDLSAIDLLDVDASGNLTIGLATATGGILTAEPANNITVGGSETASVTLTGTQTELNSYLNTLSNIQYLHSSTHLDGPNADVLSVTVSDNGNTGIGGGGIIDLGDINININAVNDDPANIGSLPVSITATEDTASNVDISQINLSDIDAASSDLTITLNTIAGGTLTAVSNVGVSISNNDSGQISLTASQDDLNTFLNTASNIQYKSALNASGTSADAIQIEVNDNGNTGTGGGSTVYLGMVNVDVDAINDDPENTGSIPTDIDVNEDTPAYIDLSLINLVDIDSASDDLTLTLTTTTGGKLKASNTTGIVVTDNDSGQITLTASQSALNTYLSLVTNVQYLSASNANGNDSDNLLVDVTDNGNTGTGGGSTINLGSINIDIAAVNDDPINAGLLVSDVTVIEDATSNVDLSLIDITDIDATTEDLTMTLATSTGGLLSANSATGVSVTGSGSNLLTIIGNQNSLNSYLNLASNIQYQSVPNTKGDNADTIQIDITDNGFSGTGGGTTINLGTVNIDIAAVNDDPINAGLLVSDVTVIEDIASNVDLSLINIIDIDATTEDLTITLATSTGGLLSANSATSVSVTGSGSSQLTLTGSQNSLNSYLNLASNIQYQSASNANGDNADTIQIDITDNGNTGTGGGSTINLGSINIDIAAVNDDPINAGLLVSDVTVIEDVTSNVDLSLINIIDIDATTEDLTMTLATSTGGLLSANSATGVSVTGSGSSLLTIIGNQNSLNSYLNLASNIQYQSVPNTNGDNADTIQIDITDNGFSGTGGGTTINIGTVNTDITAVNDAPILTLPGTQSVYEETAALINGITVADIDIGSGDITARLQASNGSLDVILSGAAVISSGNNNSAALIISGKLDDINDTLASVRYTGNPDITGTAADTLLITVEDNGNTGVGGILQDSRNIQIDITAINDSPINTIPAVITANEEIATPVSGIFVTDVDAAGGNINTRLQVTNGILNINLLGNITIISGASGSNDVTIQGTVSDINTTLASLSYTGNTNITGIAADSLLITTTDNGNSGTGGIQQDIDSVQININAINDDPALSGIESNVLEYTENDSATAITSTLTLSDVDNQYLQSATIQITTNYQDTEDQLGFNDTDNITGSWNNNRDTLTLFGSDKLANYQAALRGVTYQNTSDHPELANRTVSFSVNDGTNSSTVLTRDISITPVNDAPSGTDGTITLLEDSLHIFDTAEFGFNDNLDNNTLMAIEITAHPANGMLTNNDIEISTGAIISANDIAAEKLVYTPPPNSNGLMFTNLDFKVLDNGGTSNEGSDIDPSANTLAINITPVNDAPIGSDNALTTLEDIPLTLSASDFGYSDPIDSDSLLAVKISTLPANGELSLNGTIVSTQQSIPFSSIKNNELVFTPASNANGSAYTTIYFQVQDNGGTLNGGSDQDPAPKLLTINVTSVNDAPTGTNKTIPTLEDTPHIITTADFGFTDSSDNNAFYAVQITSVPTYGTLTLSGTEVSAGASVSVAQINNQQLSYAPAANAHGANYDAFSFQVIDDGNQPYGNNQDNTANVITFDVTSVNDAPQGTSNSVTGLEDSDYVLQTADFGFTDSADNNQFETVTIDTIPVIGQLNYNGTAVFAGQVISVDSIAAGLLVFTPEPNENGSNYEQLNFRVSDDGGVLNGGNNTDTQVRALVIDISNVNDAPQGTDNTVAVTEDISHTFQSTEFGFSDIVDSDALSGITITSLPASGSLILAGLPVKSGDVIDASDIDNGALVFTPQLNNQGSGYNGFGFQVHDNGGTANGGIAIDPTTKFISFDLTGINDSPQLLVETTTVNEGSETVVTNAMLSGTDVDDPTPEELTLTLNTVPVNGVLMLSGAELSAGDTFSLTDISGDHVRYIHDGSETASDFFEVSLTDGGEDGAQAATGRFSLVINEVIDAAPELAADSLLLEFGESFDSNSGDLLDSGYSDLNKDDLLGNNQYQIEIETPPQHGTVELTPDGKFSYVHNGLGVLQDEFTYRVTNVDGIFTLATVTISIEPPMSSAFDTKPADQKDEEPSPEPVNTIQESPVQENGTPAMEFKISSSQSLSQEQGSSIAVTEVSELQLNPRTAVSKDNQLEVIQHNSVSNVPYSNVALAVTTIDIIFEIPAKRPSEVIQNPNFLQGLNRLENDLAETDEQTRKTIRLLDNTVLGVSISAIAGVLSWALRGGALFASLMAATPLWANLDPTKVLAAPKSRDDQGSSADEEVEQLFEKE